MESVRDCAHELPHPIYCTQGPAAASAAIILPSNVWLTHVHTGTVYIRAAGQRSFGQAPDGRQLEPRTRPCYHEQHSAASLALSEAEKAKEGPCQGAAVARAAANRVTALGTAAVAPERKGRSTTSFWPSSSTCKSAAVSSTQGISNGWQQGAQMQTPSPNSSWTLP